MASEIAHYMEKCTRLSTENGQLKNLLFSWLGLDYRDGDGDIISAREFCPDLYWQAMGLLKSDDRSTKEPS